MENSILVALSSQDVLHRRLATIANNLANMDTTGFKAERLLVADDPLPLPYASPRRQTVAFVKDVATVRDPSDGRLENTGAALDVALLGDSWLVVSAPEGDRYLRGGHLRLDAGGALVTESGDPVQGEGGRPITLAPEDGEPVIARDGSISGRNGQVGRLRVVSFAPGDAPPISAGHGLATTEATPEEVAQPTVLQGMLERSNVEPLLEMEEMIEVQRAYEHARAMIDREDERIRKVVNVYVG